MSYYVLDSTFIKGNNHVLYSVTFLLSPRSVLCSTLIIFPFLNLSSMFMLLWLCAFPSALLSFLTYQFFFFLIYLQKICSLNFSYWFGHFHEHQPAGSEKMIVNNYPFRYILDISSQHSQSLRLPFYFPTLKDGVWRVGSKCTDIKIYRYRQIWCDGAVSEHVARKIPQPMGWWYGGPSSEIHPSSTNHLLPFQPS